MEKSHLRPSIHALFADECTTVVFPNETVARFWAADYARRSPKGSLFLDRSLSWDTFKQSFHTSGRHNRANRIIRYLFALQFLKHEQLAYFANQDVPGYEKRFAPTIVRAIGDLAYYRHLRAVNVHAYQALAAPLRRDVQLLETSYQTFLERNTLIDPLLEEPVSHEPEVNQRYVVCFSSLIGDYHAFSAQLGNPTWLERAPLPPLKQPLTIEEFPNEYIELTVQLERVRKLLDENVACDEIVLSVANLDELRERLLIEAHLRNIPLTITSGLSPLEYPVGALFEQLASIVSRNFSLPVMKGFLLQPALPWKDLELNQRLINRALELNIVQGGFGKDEWEEKLFGDQELLDFYRHFKHSLLHLSQARTIEDLTRELFSLLENLFYTTGWSSAEDDDIYSFCLSYLDQLRNAMERSNLEAQDNLYGVFLYLLRTSKYLSQVKGPHVRVYPYPLSAGLEVKHHFVLGLCEGRSRVTYQPLSRTNEVIDETTHFDKRDLSSTVIRLFALSGANVYFSFSRLSFGQDVLLPPTVMLEEGSVHKVEYQVSEDMLAREEALWRQRDRRNYHLRSSQRRWFKQASQTLFNRAQLDFTTTIAPAMAVGYITKKEGLFPLSATSVDSFKTCPTRWAYDYLFQVREKLSYDEKAIDYLQLGTVLHAIYQQFFATLKKRHIVLGEGMYEELLAIINRNFLQWANANNAPKPSTLHHHYMEYQRLLPLVIDRELKQFENYHVVDLEHDFRERYPEQGYLLTGRIDKILASSENPQRMTVIDFKKRVTATQKSLDPAERDEYSIQLLLYAKVLQERKKGQEVSCGVYYDIDNAKYVFDWKDDEEEKKRYLLGEVDRQLEAMVRALEAGDFRARPSKEHCQNCSYRQLCRLRYLVP